MAIRIGVPAPSWRGESVHVVRGVEVLHKAGFDVVLGAVADGRPSFNSPFERVGLRTAELVGMLRDNTIDAIWCCDGGAGASYLLPGLVQAWELSPWKTKPIVGWSDCTFLLNWMAMLGHRAFLGHTVSCETDADEQQLKEAAELFRLTVEGVFRIEYEEPADILRGGSLTSRFWGGTASVVSHIVSTRFFPRGLESTGLLFLEEHGNNAPGQGEYLFWDRLQSIWLNDGFARASGVLVGEVEREGPYADREDLFPDLWTVLEQAVAPYVSGPIVAGFPFGAGDTSRLLELGAATRLTASGSKMKIEWLAR